MQWVENQTQKMEMRREKLAESSTYSLGVGLKVGAWVDANINSKVITASIGTIRGVHVQGRYVFAAVQRDVEYIRSGNNKYSVDTDYPIYYNCSDPLFIENYSFWELAMPLVNVDLEVDLIDPRTMLGKKVRVTESNGKAIEAFYIKELASPSTTGIGVPREVLTVLRNAVGDLLPLNTDNDEAKAAISRLGIKFDKKFLDGIYDIKDWKGNVTVYQEDARWFSDLKGDEEGVKNLKVPKGVDTPWIDRQEQKTKGCHFPALLFSAR